MTSFLTTNRLILKKIEQSDFDNVLMLRTDPEVMKYAGPNQLQTRESVQKIFDEMIACQEKHGFSICCVFEKESGDFVGQAGLFCMEGQPEIELGYRLHQKFWGRGYGTELATALIKWGFEHLSVTCLVAFVDLENTASHRVLQKSGMINLGVTKCQYGELVKYVIYKM